MRTVFFAFCFLLLLSSCSDDQKQMSERLKGAKWNISEYYEEYGQVKLQYPDAGYIQFNDEPSGTRHLIVNGDTAVTTFTYNLGFESITITEGADIKTYRVLTNEDSRQVWEYNKEEDIIRYTLSK